MDIFEFLRYENAKTHEWHSIRRKGTLPKRVFFLVYFTFLGAKTQKKKKKCMERNLNWERKQHYQKTCPLFMSVLVTKKLKSI